MERTNQDMPLFRRDDIKSLLTEILIVWAGKNPDTQYKQGMNELAALVLLALSQEQQTNPNPQASDKELAEA